ncbi:MAG TPA: hypothetical protein VNQ76_01580 [Planctomicrobium sp.]|nr:hypothetical protein [Planctomicrobium sp.]
MEFAFISFIMVTMMGVTITIGYFLYAAQTLQQVVDVAAQEIARMPYAPTDELGLGRTGTNNDAWVMHDPDFRDQIYKPELLIVTKDTLDGHGFQEFMADQPLVNRLLSPLMIFEKSPDGTDWRYRYPGTIVNDTENNYQTVLIPIMEYNADGSEEFINWVAPVEEISRTDGMFPYAVDSSSDPMRGVVALRINYPAQSGLAVKIPFQQLGQKEFTEPNDDFDNDPSSTRFTVLGNDFVGVYNNQHDHQVQGGRYGLGRLFINRNAADVNSEPIPVRPYRKVISVQAIYRRELFQ